MATSFGRPEFLASLIHRCRKQCETILSAETSFRVLVNVFRARMIAFDTVSLVMRLPPRPPGAGCFDIGF